MVSIFDITQRAKKGLVLFFYPKAATPGCTKEACSFRDQYQVFQDAGAEVVGISGDGVEAQKSFASGNRLPFPLLSDTGDIVRKGFGIPNDMFGLLPGRQTYVISKDGKCVLAFNDALNFEAHVKSALDAVKVLQ